MGQNKVVSNDDDDDGGDDVDGDKDDGNVVCEIKLTRGGDRYTGRTASVETTGPGRWPEGRVSGTWRNSGSGPGAAGVGRRYHWQSSRWGGRVVTSTTT